MLPENDEQLHECKWCGSDRHPSDNCPTQNLVKFLTGKKLKRNANLPNHVVITDEHHLVPAIEEAHAIQHIKRRKAV